MGGCGGLERTHFNSFYFGAVVVLKELIFTVSTVGGCDGLEVTDFFTVSTSGHSGAFVRPDFEQLIP